MWAQGGDPIKFSPLPGSAGFRAYDAPHLGEMTHVIGLLGLSGKSRAWRRSNDDTCITVGVGTRPNTQPAGQNGSPRARTSGLGGLRAIPGRGAHLERVQLAPEAKTGVLPSRREAHGAHRARSHAPWAVSDRLGGADGGRATWGGRARNQRCATGTPPRARQREKNRAWAAPRFIQRRRTVPWARRTARRGPEGSSLAPLIFESSAVAPQRGSLAADWVLGGRQLLLRASADRGGAGRREEKWFNRLAQKLRLLGRHCTAAP